MPRSLTLYLAGLLLVIGCSSKSTQDDRARAEGSPSGQRNTGSTMGETVTLNPLDPCPERLHNLAGALLDFLVKYDRLPPTLEDLTPLGQTPLETSCPMSKHKYIYNPNGIKLPPARWAIVY